MATLTVTGLDENIAELEQIAGRIRDLRPLFEVLGQDLKTFIDDRFEQSNAPDGSRWVPLAPSTLRRRGSTAKPLIDTERLRNSTTTSATSRSLRFGSNVEYAGAQHFGSAQIPARPFFPVERQGGGFAFIDRGQSREELERIRNAIREYILNGVIR